ncbi:MAG: EAL domain-containing protein [Sulfuriferula sp.]|nr:EAL domain-containing protein [Sulfuriferula sp.]
MLTYLNALLLTLSGLTCLALYRHHTTQQKAKQHQLLATRVFETTDEAIIITDPDVNIIAVNPAFCRITGYSETEVLGKNPRMLSSGRHDKQHYQRMWQTLLREGTWAGEIWNRRKSGETYPEWQTISEVRDSRGKLINYIAVFADISSMHRAQAMIENLSWRDPLTGMANRALFLNRIEQAIANAAREGLIAYVLLLDIDRFKNVNEAYGPITGDALLKAIAERFSHVLRKEDVLARLDSDAFALLIPCRTADRIASGHEIVVIAEKLRVLLHNGVEVDGRLIHLDAGIGISVITASSHEIALDVLHHADMAMRQAKSADTNRIVFFEAAMGAAIMQLYQLEQELHLAVAHNELRLYLQPQVDANGVQVGAEALVRWQHPERGLISPAVFIPMAETSDLIIAIDRWMMAGVCKLLAQLKSQGSTLHISINVSPRHFRRADFVDEIKAQLAVSGADAGNLVLEVTEGLVIGDIDQAVAKMNQLKSLGIHFSMDDFGTGYSSLSYLKRLPIQELKIDKSFIDDIITDANAAVLVETILAVARHLHLQVVAEGIETQAQVDFLNSHGAVIHQGYLFGHPEPVEQWLSKLPAAT